MLIYGSESLVVSPLVMRELEGFYVEAVWWLTGMRLCVRARALTIAPWRACVDDCAAARRQRR